MTLILGLLFVAGVVVLVLGIAQSSYGAAERREAARRSKDGPRWR